MLPKDYRPGDVVNVPTEMGAADGFVPDASLRAETQEDLYAMRYADSITVDPHKAGYIPYPAGGLCYRDERMRFLVTWTSPYLSRGSVTSIGIYGVEGSKPGASAMSGKSTKVHWYHTFQTNEWFFSMALQQNHRTQSRRIWFAPQRGYLHLYTSKLPRILFFNFYFFIIRVSTDFAKSCLLSGLQ